MFVCCECCVLSGRSLYDELITRPEESCRLWCVVVCDIETSRMRRPWPALDRSATDNKILSLIYLITYLLTYSKEQNPSWEPNRFLASQEISFIIWNPNNHYRIHKCPLPVPIHSQIDPVHILHGTFCRSILILSPSTPGSSKWSLALSFLHQNTLPHACYMHLPFHSSRFDHPNNNG